ncbi:MAG: molybdenum ABC transporter ATP-binding protein [Alphaproteobacteria bacterium]|nr:molybdenum ABC transporter ATP-binding protein [Alphaproteobacteria bacterium]MBO6629089.1 molybdenum ABC transporter ATP-binding protein [Alphaproteobacteria bacterium]MDF1624908.1 molybdenum ABC transporter ATP-binding protein [Parvibaculaceae bacterium]|tara:strand:+ start:61 stop:1188 length:1128 start_codon:yes stop_codon:yes gene_type:complete
MSAHLSVNIARRLPDFELTAAFEAGNGVTSLLGVSGAGKSMTLHCIAGLADPHHGKITLNGQTLFDHEEHIILPPEKRELGVVFQESRLFPHMTIRTNLNYGATQTRKPLADFNEIVSLLDIEPLLDRRPHHLSGGEKQRVAIGRALLSSPTALLMDEPLANLDLLRRREILPFIERLKDRFQLPILYVSHNLDETIRLADQVLIMRAGRIVASGPTEETLSRIEVQSILFGENQSPEPLTIVSGHIAERHPDGLVCIETPWGRIVAPNVEGKIGHRLRLRIRARDIILSKREPSDLSIRNTIEGEIGLMAEAGDSQVDVLVRPNGNPDSPVTPALWARITKHAAADLSLTPGTKVWALLKAVVLATDIDLDALN